MSNQPPAPNPQPERTYDEPVAWLLGQQMIGSIKGLLLYTAYGKKLDPRDWMQPEVFPHPDRLKSLEVWRDRHQTAAQAQGKQVSLNATEAAAFWDDRKEFWFDYLADAGDGTKAMYSLAYLCLSDLWVKQLDDDVLPPQNDRDVKVREGVEGFSQELPRGEFLLIGGDTAYHAADYITLANRIQHPFCWAYEDLVSHRRISWEDPARPLFGIPGNHDYYDQLDGFRRQFRLPVRREPKPGPGRDNRNTAQLGIAGFHRAQEASYVALQLPFGWWVWALDTEVGQIDRRQRRFFRSLGEPKADGTGDIEPPAKLIMATCAPTTFFGKIAEKTDYKSADAIAQLGLSQPFLPDSEKRPDGTFDLSTTGDAKIESGQCRLDLSGDVHQYARYWGPASPNSGPSRKNAKAEGKTAASYASIVSGLGGAFHHPTPTYDDQVREQVLYPDEKTSRDAVAERIFNFWNIKNGGYVWLAGLVIAFVICFAVSVPQSSRQFLSNISPIASVLDLPQERFTPPTTSLPADFDSSKSIKETLGPRTCGPVEPILPWHWVGMSKEGWTPPQPCSPENALYFSSLSPRQWPVDFTIGVVLVFASLLATVLTFVFSSRLFGAEDEDPLGADVEPSEKVTVGGEKRIQPAKVDPEIKAEPNKKILIIIVPTTLAAFLGLAALLPYRGHISAFVNSLLVLLTIIWAAGATALAIRYSEFLFKKSHQRYIRKSDWALPWGLSIISLLSVASGLWFFGKNTLASLLVSDILFVLVLVGSFLLLLLLPFLMGAELLKNRGVPNWLRIVGMLLIGLWHAVLQLAVPIVLVRRGNSVTLLVTIVLVFVSIPVGAFFLQRNSKTGLTLAWIVYGALMFALPWITAGYIGLDAPFAGEGWLGWSGLVPSIVAGLVGAVMCCVWFGWYLGVSFIFNGHNNEVGGAARIEEFKEFIRFRVNKDGLTGYVIALDKVSMIGEAIPGETRKKDGEYLEPKLIDVFHLQVKPASRAPDLNAVDPQ